MDSLKLRVDILILFYSFIFLFKLSSVLDKDIALILILLSTTPHACLTFLIHCKEYCFSFTSLWDEFQRISISCYYHHHILPVHFWGRDLHLERICYFGSIARGNEISHVRLILRDFKSMKCIVNYFGLLWTCLYLGYVKSGWNLDQFIRSFRFSFFKDLLGLTKAKICEFDVHTPFGSMLWELWSLWIFLNQWLLILYC